MTLTRAEFIYAYLIAGMVFYIVSRVRGDLEVGYSSGTKTERVEWWLVQILAALSVTVFWLPMVVVTLWRKL